MKYKSIIFDFNGVLWWDNDIQEQAWQETANKIRGKEFTEEELREHLHGRNNKHTLQYLLGREIINESELSELTQLKEENYRQKCLAQGNNFCLSPGAEILLEHLKKNNIPRTIATASEITNLEFFFKHLQLERWFQFETIIYDDGLRPGKPDPSIYLDAAKVLSTRPESCVVIEDALSGMKAAFDAKIGFLVALGSKNTHTKLAQVPGVKAVITRLDEIIEMSLFN